MINLQNIVKTSFIFWLKKIITILLLILIVAGFIWLFCIANRFFILLDKFLTIKLNFSFYYLSGLYAISYYFSLFLFKFIAKILDLYDNLRNKNRQYKKFNN
jgi:cell shape-determining protein MreC